MSIVRLGNLLLAFFGLVAIGATVGAVVCLATGRFELVPSFLKYALAYGGAAVAPRFFAHVFGRAGRQVTP